MHIFNKLIRIADILYTKNLNNNYKRYYKIGASNIFVIIMQKITEYNEYQKNETIKKLQKQIYDIGNNIESKIDFEIAQIKYDQNYVLAIGRYEITNYNDDQCRKIIHQLSNLNFDNKDKDKIKTRDRFTITTQKTFY